MRWLFSLLALCVTALAQPVCAKNAALDRAVSELRRGNALAAQEDIWAARRAGINEADTRHLMAQAYLLQGDAIRALAEADAAKIPPQFIDYAAKIRIKADLLRNDIAAARNELSQALARQPNDDELWSDLARVRAKDGDLAGAIIAGRKAALLNPKSVDALLLSASLARDQSGLRAAIPWFNRVLEIDPKNISALLELAATQGDSGQAQAMLATTRRVLALDKNNPQAFYLQAVIAARANRPDLARELLYHSLPALERLPGVMLLHSIIELESGNNEQAITQLKLLQSVQPNNLRLRRLLGALYAQSGDDYAVIETLLPLAKRPDADSYALITIARAYENIDERIEAAKYLDRAAQPFRGPATPFDPGGDISLLARNDTDNPNNAESAVPFLQGMILSGHYDDAIGKAQNLAGLNPGVPLAHVLVGDAQMAAGHFPLAAQAYQRAANITLTEPIIMRQVNALQRAGERRAADGVLALFLRENPNDQAALSLAAGQDIEAGRWDSAISRLENLRSRLGNCDANLLNSLAWSWFNAGDPKRALPYARAAYALQSGNPAVANTYGWLLFQTSLNHQSGLALLEKAVSIAPHIPSLRLQLAEAYITIGQKAAARKVLEPLADKVALPEHVAVARLLQRL